jgi:hypothetical protein
VVSKGQQGSRRRTMRVDALVRRRRWGIPVFLVFRVISV